MKTNFKNKKIALLGLGIENQALLSFLNKKYKNLDITICDTRSASEIKNNIPEIKNYKNIKWKTGADFNKNLKEFSLLFRSPGWPINCPGIQEALEKGSQLSSPMNLFFELCPSKNIIGITGTKGKGTTASLIFEIIKNSGKKCFLGGNIGIAPLNFLKEIKKDDWIVLELSSFQLEDLHYSPKIAIITNIFKEHLSPADPLNPNFHNSLKSYLEAKLNITFYQEKNDFFIINKKLKNKIDKYQTLAKKIYFTKSQTPSQLVGDFNKENISASEQVANILKINKKIVKETIKNFNNLNHRLEFIRVIKGVKYFDNSFSTTPESTILDLKSFKKNIILLAGGADKGADFSKLANEIKKRVKFVILFPDKGGLRIKKELKKINYPCNKLAEVRNMEKAVKTAQEKAQKNDIVLLSTACASFGIFKNYKERGNLFQNEVEKLKQ
ncbi:MAG: UDP-N-acetylmuramoyl-L-alanine--D-glutamate ligase [Patescibacteria group bacterium]|nr:UDP-N-acetylmuramoyl-L-alanine--D-glutamate ligase [Patescibacteria group bacterium]